MGAGILAAALVAARFTTIQTDAAIRDAACSIVANAKVGEEQRPFDVEVDGKRCQSEPRPDDALTLAVNVAPREYGLREVVIQLDAPEDFAEEDARNTVTQLGRVLKTRVAATPIQAIVHRHEKTVHASPGLYNAGLVLTIGGSVVVAAGLLVGLALLVNGAGQSASCSVKNFVQDPTNDKSCAPDIVGLGAAGAMLGGGALSLVIGAVMVTIGGRQVTVSF